MSDIIVCNPPFDGRGDALPSALPQVHLVGDGADVLVAPADGPSLAGPAFAPFPLPPVRKSLSDWLAILCEDFWHRHRRCLAAVLLLDPLSRGWSTAVPAQRAARDASCWSARAADLPGVAAGLVLAGSFQARVLAAGEDPADAPPPHDGVHLVQTVGPDGEPREIRAYLRAGGRTRAVPADAVLADDWRAALDEAWPRVRLV